MDPPHTSYPMIDQDSDITATVLRERAQLGNFIRRQVGDPAEAEDILQDVFQGFVQAYRLPAPIEQASAWLFRVARNRIIDRFRKKKEQAFGEASDELDETDETYRCRLPMPAPKLRMRDRSCWKRCARRSTSCRRINARFSSRTNSRESVSRRWRCKPVSPSTRCWDASATRCCFCAAACKRLMTHWISEGAWK
jgi:RNA polymerase sigma factor (sigma-70 family)